MFKLFLVFIGVAGLALGGAVLLLIWISSLTPIHVTEDFELSGSPPNAEDWIEQGAVIFAMGEVELVHGAEWSTSDGSRPSTPWDVSDVPDETWIQTPIIVNLESEPVVLQSGVITTLDSSIPSVDVILALRGGEIGEDRYEINDGQDRDFEPGDRVGLVLSVKDQDLSDPEFMDTTLGEGWEFLGRYRIEDDTAVLQWGDETQTQPLSELIEEFRQASR